VRSDGAFALVADVHEDFAGADFEDGALDDASLFEVAKRTVLGEQFLHFDHLICDDVSNHGYRIVLCPGQTHMRQPIAGKGAGKVAPKGWLAR